MIWIFTQRQLVPVLLLRSWHLKMVSLCLMLNTMTFSMKTLMTIAATTQTRTTIITAVTMIARIPDKESTTTYVPPLSRPF